MLNLVIDPPWPKKKGNLREVRPNQSRELDYETMPVSEIFSLLDRDVLPLRHEVHNVWLWTVDEFLIQAEQEMIGRDYRLHARLVWNKGNGPAPAFTIRYSHEYVLWFYRPKLQPICEHCRGKFTSVFSGSPREHSRKPDEFYEFIETIYPDSKKIDVFSRECRPGWSQFGNEISKFDRTFDILSRVLKK